MTEDERYHTIVQGAAAIEIVVRCSEGYGDLVMDYRFASILHRLLKDSDYRSLAEQAWGELFEGQNEDRLNAVMQEIERWRNNYRNLSASGTAGTPPTSRLEQTPRG